MDLITLFDSVERTGSKLIVDGPRTLSYTDLLKRCKQIYSLLQSAGLSPGDRIGIATTDEIGACALILSCLRLGFPLAMIDTGAKRSEAESIIQKLELKALFIDSALAQTWSEPPSLEDHIPCVWHVTGSKKKLISRLLGKKEPQADVTRNYPECLSHHPGDRILPEPPATDSPALMLCTSGTTGLPKILQLSYANLFAAATTTSRMLRLDSDSRVLNLLPLTHYDGIISGLFTTFWNSGTLIRIGPFTVSLLPEIFDALYKYKASHLLLTPSILALILRLGDDIKAAFAASDFRFVISVAATLPAKQWQDFNDKTGKKVVNVFGLSETGNNLFAGPDEESYRIGSIGKPSDCSAMIVNEQDQKAAAGETGELLLEGASITSGYLGEPVVTKAINGGNWFATGDLAYCDDSGVYWLVGRKKNIIIVGGRNVYPDEINNALLTHPSVIEAATLGLQDEVWGERVVSCVVTEGGVTSADLLQHATKYLADYKVPREIHLVSDLPKGRSGKVILKELAHRLEQGSIAASKDKHAGIEDKVITLASESFRTPKTELSLKTAPANCSMWDSVAHMDFIMNLEKNFQIEFQPNEVIRIVTLEAAVNITRSKL